MQTVEIVVKKLAAFFIDLFVVSILLDVIVLILLQFDQNGAISHALHNASGNTLTYTVSQIQVELYFGFIFIAALYQYICIFIIARSIGMLAMGLIYTASDVQGNPRGLNRAQQFLRGFICTFLTYFFLCIPAIANPFDGYARSMNDYLSHTVIIQKSSHKFVIFIAISIIILSLLFFAFAVKSV